MHKKRIAKILIVILLLIILGILFIKLSFVNKENEVNFINVVKQQLLKKESSLSSNNITGKVCISENECLSDIELGLYIKKGDEFVKSDIAYTDSFGNYIFKNISEGSYKINVLNTDEYKSENDNLTFEINNLNESQNIDINVVRLDNFKAEISKYIKSVILNVNGNKYIYNYDKKNKVNISVKNMQNLNGTITYEFEVKNVKNVDGYVKVIKDTLPEGLTFNQSKNKDWKEKNGNLYTTVLKDQIIKPGETKIVDLVLDINNTKEAKSYLNKVNITKDVYHNVNFISFDKTISSEKVVDGDTVNKKGNLELDGYKFMGWYSDKKFTKKFDFLEPITNDANIYAKWVKIHKVNFIVDDSVYKSENVLNMENVMKPDVPIKEGYSFINWYSDSNYDTLFDFDSKITKDTNIYAKFEEDIKYYNVTYILEGKEYKKEILKAGSKVNNISVPKKSSVESSGKLNIYTFSGWYSDSSYNNLYDFEQGISNNLILYGKYISSTVCKTVNNIEITTKEDITKKLESSEKIEKDVIENYQTVDLKRVDGNETYAVTDNYVAQLNTSTNTYSLVQYTGNDYSNIVIPDFIDGIKVTQILGNIFDNKNIKKIKISKNITSIYGAFNNSTINNIDFSYAISLKEIFGSFTNSNISEINLSNSINLMTIDSSFNGSNINDIRFGNAYKLSNISTSFISSTSKNLYLENSINLDSVAFVSQMDISNTIDFGNAISVSKIPSGFINSKNTENINLNNALGITEIESNAFVDGNIINFDFGNAINLSTINSGSFIYSLNVEVLDMSKLFNLKKINANAFTNNKLIKSIMFSTSIEIIDESAFKENNIEVVDFSCATNLKEIRGYSFKKNNISNVVLKDLPSLVSVELDAFMENNLKLLQFENLPSLVNLTNSDGSSFWNESLTTSKSEFIIDNTALETLEFKTKIYYPIFSRFVVQNNKKLTEVGTLFVGRSAADNESVHLRDIEFINNENLRVFKSESIVGINTYKLILEDLPNLETIENKAFYETTKFVDSIELRDLPNLKTIGDYAFYFDRYVISKNNSVVLSNLPMLESIGTSAFELWGGAKNLILDKLPSLKRIGDFAFAGHMSERLTLNSTNVPSLEYLGNESFWPFSSNDNIAPLKYIEISDLQYLSNKNVPLFMFIGSLGRTNNKIILEKLTLSNLPTVDNIMITSSGIGIPPFTKGVSRIKNLTIKNLPKLTLNAEDASNIGIEKINLINLPSVTTIPTRFFAYNNIKEVDLTKLGNLTKLEDQVFLDNHGLKTVKLPSTIEEINLGVFSNDSIECIEFEGDSSKFYGNNIYAPGSTDMTYWTYIGLSNDLKPGVCSISNETSSNNIKELMANILNPNVSLNGSNTYNIILYKMDDNSLIDDSNVYKLMKLNNKNYEDVNVSTDIENTERYIISDEENDKIKSFNNKIYIRNVSVGAYKLINTLNNSELNFVLEENGTITGNAKISNVTESDTIMSSSEALLNIMLQTGGSKKIPSILLSVLVFILGTLFIIRKKEI